METVYLNTPGVKVHSEGKVLQVRQGREVLHTVFPFRTGTVVISPGVEITSRAIMTLLRNGINTVFVNSRGTSCGRLAGPTGSHVATRMAQYRLLDDNQRCLAFCRAVVEGKVRNQLVMAGRIGRFQKRDVSAAVARMKHSLAGTGKAVHRNTLRGIEGACARAYFSIFDLGFTVTQGFTGRARRPPSDPVNALLSFLYMALLARVTAEIEQEGLDPYAGILHETGYCSPALALDLVEEFRTILADTLVFSLFNLGIVTPDDFRTVAGEEPDEDDIFPDANPAGPDALDDPMAAFSREDTLPAGARRTVHTGRNRKPGSAAAVLLTGQGLKKVASQLERKLEAEFTCPIDHTRISYRQAMARQVRRFKAFVHNERDAYEPLVMR
ncbi:MAG TPA: CRISPR-associated endonuclease Cas1 [Deltaproteobacteria bacterium]|nr:CRISPR-associated endonuclease Cas1 [Deltaproteobacteria bacterium]HQI80838.1 CRISPR-associated endonuclease Cas1 [Deltaproteobacteria bacterium]